MERATFNFPSFPLLSCVNGVDRVCVGKPARLLQLPKLVMFSRGADMQVELPVGFPSWACCINTYALHMFAFLLENTSSWVSG